MIMFVPPVIHNLITTSLQEMHEDPEHHLRPIRRLDVYRELGWSTEIAATCFTQFDTTGRLLLPTGYQRYGYLALLTARHVIPLWEQELPEIQALDETIETDVPYRLLEIAEMVLQQQSGAVEAARFL